MLLDLEDVRVRVFTRRMPHDRARLTLDYPRTEEYRRRVLDALADLLREAEKPSDTTESRPAVKGDIQSTPDYVDSTTAAAR